MTSKQIESETFTEVTIGQALNFIRAEATERASQSTRERLNYF